MMPPPSAAAERQPDQRPAAAGQVEVLNDTTLLLRLEPEEQSQSEADEAAGSACNPN